MDLEKTMRFILEQQAAAEAHHAAAEAHRAEGDARHEQWKASFEKTQAAIQQTQLQQLTEINRLLDISVSHEGRLGDVEAWSKAAQEKLDAIVAVVDSLVRRKN